MLVYENDTRCVLLGLLEEVSDSGCTYADEHLYEVRSAYGEERHAGFSGCGSGNIRLTCSRRAYQQYAFRYPGPQAVVFGRMFEEVDDLFEFLLFLLQARHILECYLLEITILLQLGSALAERHGFAPASALVHYQYEEHYHDGYHDECRQQRYEYGFFLRLRALHFDLMLIDHRHDI